MTGQAPGQPGHVFTASGPIMRVGYGDCWCRGGQLAKGWQVSGPEEVQPSSPPHGDDGESGADADGTIAAAQDCARRSPWGFPHKRGHRFQAADLRLSAAFS